jgi:hypothetical protein
LHERFELLEGPRGAQIGIVVVSSRAALDAGDLPPASALSSKPVHTATLFIIVRDVVGASLSRHRQI